MRKVDLAYYAGIIDADGCITISKEKSKSKIHPYMFSLRVQISSVDEWICQQMKFAFGGSVCIAKQKTIYRKPLLEWQVANRKAEQFLEMIFPYLRLKRPQAEIALKFQRAKRNRTGKPKDEKELAVEEAQRLLIQSWNRKGTKS